MIQLLREIFKPAYKYISSAEYREWIYVKSHCRNKALGTPVSLKINGFRVSGGDAESFRILYEDIFVNRFFDINFSVKNPIIFSCGANIGLEIFFFKKYFPKCIIYAFESDPVIAKILDENISKNNLKDVTVISAAVWKKSGTINFQPDGALGGKTGTGNVLVNAIRLADELKNQNKIDLLIMDIEGAEIEVLKDCENELPKIENLFVEWHGRNEEAQNFDEMLALIGRAGFRYRLKNNLNNAPFRNRITENGFDAMVQIYASKINSNSHPPMAISNE